ncbi:MAG: regulatory signaling modulator protein AmpE [Gammaproteobacteria bacterium]|nr:regulatory signaling modulator protein AmpE [Gammaproteobacteria bacterium]MCW8841460.1 regulatory signaling modulator protein AmpE [Gammaproteobacteria bacterium]MCW8927884.1 regulatory signaling modulator protein AmpE [Gammaproteobacteria bacterium]MCW8958141.1 regulatory signaling modulator protein AmpE [Gammaproteobacteria bacterium]MCW8973868.1 regulatory signaling modulator protein AmpE [Gammaproteobacteria bacterium]
MALIAIIISLVAERFLGSMEEFRRFGWFRRYAGWLLPRLSPYRYLNGPAGVILLLLIPLGVVSAVDYYLGQWWVVLSLLFSVLVLLFSFGPTDLEAEVEAYIDARERGDEESACWHASELLGEEPPEGAGVLARRIIENTLVEANERVLAILLWFLLLGPAGALMYRLTSQLELYTTRHGGEALAEPVQRLHAILAWLPGRICAFSYALAGSFVDALQAWGRQQESWHENNRAVLIASGLGALGYHEGDETAEQEGDSEVVHETLDLVRRAVLVFLSVIALFTLAGWMA